MKVMLVVWVFRCSGCEMPGVVCVTADVSGCVVKAWPLSVPCGAGLPSFLFGPRCTGWSGGGWGALVFFLVANMVFVFDTPGKYVQYVTSRLAEHQVSSPPRW